MPAFLDAIDADLVEPERLAGSVIDQLLNEKRKQPDKRRSITFREALIALDTEALFTVICAENMARAIELNDADCLRLRVACQRITTIRKLAG